MVLKPVRITEIITAERSREVFNPRLIPVILKNKVDEKESMIKTEVIKNITKLKNVFLSEVIWTKDLASLLSVSAAKKLEKLKIKNEEVIIHGEYWKNNIVRIKKENEKKNIPQLFFSLLAKAEK